MAKEITTRIQIQAVPEKVWAVLTDFNAYPNWNPFITSLTGEVAPGKKITVHLKPPGAKGMSFQPTVLAFDANQEFRWLGRLLFKGLFDGEHCFRLIDNNDGSTTLVHSERFRGVLVPFLRKMLDNNTLQGFTQMNESLKNRVENMGTS